MTTISIELNKKTLSNLSTISARVYHNKKLLRISTGVQIDERYYTGDILQPIKKEWCNAFVDNERVTSIVRKLQYAVFELEHKGVLNQVSAIDIRDYAMGVDIFHREGKDEPVVKRKESFTEWLGKFGEGRRTENTRKSYMYAVKTLSQFRRTTHSCEVVRFSDMTYAFLSDFDNWMEQTGKGDHARYMILSYMRSAFRDALCREITNVKDPFVRFKIRKPVVAEEIDFIPLKKMQGLLSLDLTSLSGVRTLEMARDIMMISIYLCGANLKDIYEMPLQPSDEVSFIRSKIQDKGARPMHIHIQPELAAIIDKYRGKKHLFNFCEVYENYETFRRNITKRLERLSIYVGYKLDMAMARRTWATYAGDLEIEELVIDKSMGHKDNNILRKHYQHYKWARTDKANATIIAYIMNGVTPNSIIAPAYAREVCA